MPYLTNVEENELKRLKTLGPQNSREAPLLGIEGSRGSGGIRIKIRGFLKK
jgi:hypothetical protein